MFERIKLYFYRRKLEKQRKKIAANAFEAGQRAAEQLKNATTAFSAFAEGLNAARISGRSGSDED